MKICGEDSVSPKMRKKVTHQKNTSSKVDEHLCPTMLEKNHEGNRWRLIPVFTE